jgi:branched-chain amino acid transport system substrate-binding protein
MRRRTFSKLLIPAIALALLATPAMAQKKKPVKIGLLYALSGLAAVYTKGTVIGHQIAAEEINAAGGVLGGRMIKFVIRDNKLKPGIAVKEFRRMVTRDKVDFVMGIISSGVALAVSQVAKEMKVLFVDTIAQTAALTGEQGHMYVIRTNTNSTVIGRTAALAASKKPWKKYYFIGPDYEWGHRVNADFWDFLRVKKEGVEKLGDLWPKLGERDYSAHITAMLNAKPDAVFSSLWGGDLIAFIKQASAYGFFDKIQYISTGGGDLDLLKPLGDDMPDGVLATYLYAFDTSPVKQEENKKFIAEFKKRAGYIPKSGDIIGYVSTHMLAQAMNKAGSAKSEDIVKAMRGAKFSTILGDIEVRKIDGQATFAYHAGYTYKNPKYPFKRLKDVTRAEGLEVLRTDAEVIKARADYKKKGS